jgi:hydrogenase/urease accessory protein HupE
MFAKAERDLGWALKRPRAALDRAVGLFFLVDGFARIARKPSCNQSSGQYDSGVQARTLVLNTTREGAMGKRRRTSSQSRRRPGALGVAAGLSLAAYAGASAALLWRAPR